MATALSLIIPASNEAAHIGACLSAVCASDGVAAGEVDVIVVANGCSDDTAEIARSFSSVFDAKGWPLVVLDLKVGGKILALNAGDTAAVGASRAYLDADVEISKTLISNTLRALDTEDARYVSGEVHLAQSRNWITATYGRFYALTPFMQQSAPGCGFFAMNKAGRSRWSDWPEIISDDTFARLSFAPSERVEVAACYDWPLVEGFANLVRVRRRQNTGVAQVGAMYPELAVHDDKPSFTMGALLGAVRKAPLGFAVYAAVNLLAKITPGSEHDWRRGR